jgi:hypothetical protein
MCELARWISKVIPGTRSSRDAPEIWCQLACLRCVFLEVVHGVQKM